MHPLRRVTAYRLPSCTRALRVVLACLTVATVSLAATGGGASKDPGTAVLTAAHAHLGDSYTWGGDGPDTWDCSGFTSTMWRVAGGVSDMPRTSQQQHAWAVPLPAAQVLTGDLVFFGDPVTHVGLVKSRKTGPDGVVVVRMVDASSSQHGVVERDVWTSGIVRYGRVPRPGMVPVAPWVRPAPEAVAPPSPRPSSGPSAPVAPEQASASNQQHTASGKRPLTGLPTTQAGPSSRIALKAAKLAQAALGNVTLTDVELIRNVWRRAGGAALPAGRAALTAAGTVVAVTDVRVGDLVIYAAPAAHVGIYMGGGQMVDASRALGKVVSRPVWSAPGLRLIRLSA